MGKIITNEIFQERIKNLINSDLELLGKYVDSTTKIPCKCKKCGYEWSMLPGNIQKGKGCPKCAIINNKNSKLGSARQINQEKLKILSKEKNYTLLSNYVDSKTKVKCKCNICNYEWEAIPGNLLKGSGCYKCGRRSTGEKLKELYTIGSENYIRVSKTYNKNPIDKQKWFLERATILHPEYDYSNTIYRGSTENISIICPKHGEFTIYAGNFLYKNVSCPVCKQEEKRKTSEEFQEELKNINSNTILLNNYVNWDIKVKVQCKKCGNIWESFPLNLLRGRSCPKCNQSKGEKAIEKVLNENNIEHLIQYQIKVPSSINSSGNAYIDFYLPDYNLFIEYNGIQHYIPIEYFGGKLSYEHQFIRDNYIKQYCTEHNIELLEISYTQYNDISSIINNKLKQMKVI